MSLAHHYSRAKAGLMGINPVQATEHAEKLLIAGGTGLVLGLVSASMGGLDHKVLGMNVPVDGIASMGLALAGLSMHSPELLTASIAAGGSAATRSFEAIFKKGLGAHGDFDSNDLPFGFGAPPAFSPGAPAGGQFNPGYGFGQDRLVEAAKALG